jgi:isoquinoline 1-oxidoreductase alpha subunit
MGWPIKVTAMNISVNKELKVVDVTPDTPLLWVIREQFGLTGTKYGCGIGQCGACTIHLDGVPVRSCLTPVQAAADKEVTTIEGIASGEKELHILQQAWIEEQVPQCGYCQSGQLMTAHALLRDNPNPTDAEIEEAMNGNICRCGTYSRIKNGIVKAAAAMAVTTNINEESHGEMD